MIRPLLIGLVAGLRALTPLTAISAAAGLGRLGVGTGPLRHLRRPAVTGGLALLAAGEVVGDKLRFAPDRTIPPGLAARLATGGVAGAALSRPRERIAGATLGALGAVIGGHLGLDLRKRAMARHGQARSGVVEDAIAIVLALLVVGEAARRLPRDDVTS